MRKSISLSSIQTSFFSAVQKDSTRYLPRIVLVIFLLLLLQTLAKLSWQLFESDSASVSTPRTGNTQTASRQQIIEQPLSAVSRYHLFGKVQSEPAITRKLIDAPETRLRLSLKGVFATTDQGKALAIIATNKDKEQTYQVGDTITAGARLHAVYADRVILQRNGRLETLRLPKPKLDTRQFYQSRLNSRNLTGNAVGQALLPRTDTLTGQAGGSRQALRNIRDTLLTNPAKLWGQVRITPAMKNGKVYGYRLRHNDTKLMKSLNLRETDVITGINGQSLADPSTLYSLMNTLKSERSLQVTIERNGQKQQLQLQL